MCFNLTSAYLWSPDIACFIYLFILAHYVDFDDVFYRFSFHTAEDEIILIEALLEHLYCSNIFYLEELVLLQANAAGHHMPHNLGGFHEPFGDKILLSSLLHFTGFSSICVSFSYLKIYITHCIYRLHPSADYCI